LPLLLLVLMWQCNTSSITLAATIVISRGAAAVGEDRSRARAGWARLGHCFVDRVSAC